MASAALLSWRSSPPPRTLLIASSSELRASTLARVQDLVAAGTPVVTLAGPGGIGKTWTARRLAAANDATFVDLAAETTAEGLVRAVADALDMPTAAGDLVARANAVAAEIVARESWLILDNLEQLASAAAEIVEGWCVRGARRLVATSRIPLEIDAETVVRLEPLDTESGILFFAERAAASVDAERDRDAIAAIVGLVGGNPLGLELAASHTVLAGAGQIRDVLRRGAPLDDVDGTRAERHASLDAVVSSTWELLDATARGHLRRLSMFQGRFDLAAANALGVDARSLGALRRWSLIATASDVGHVELRMFEEVRRWVRGSHPPDAEIQRAYATWAADAAEAAVEEVRGGQAGVRQQLSALFPDLRAVIRDLGGASPALAARCVHGAVLFLAQRHPEQAVAFCRDFEGLARRAAPAQATAIANLHARSLRRLGRGDEALRQVDRVLAVTDDPVMRGRLLVEQAHLMAYAGRVPEAVAASAAAIEAVEAAGDVGMYGRAWRVRSVALRLDGQPEAALAALHTALGFSDAPSGRLERLNVLVQLIHNTAASDDEALEWYAQALVLEQGLASTDPRVEAVVHSALAQRMLKVVRLDAAREALARALPLLERFDTRTWITLRVDQALVEALELPADDGDRMVRVALDLVRRHGIRQAAPWVLTGLGVSAHRERRLDEAIDTYRRAIELAEERGIVVPATNLLPLAQAEAGLPAQVSDAHAPEIVRLAVAAWQGRGDIAAVEDALAGLRVRSLHEAWLQRIVPRVLQARPTWTIAATGQWFDPPGADRVDLGRRLAARRILARLVSAVGASEALGVDDLIEAGWPGERMRTDSGRARAYVVIRDLRKLGLDRLIQTIGGGYRLDPGQEVRGVPES